MNPPSSSFRPSPDPCNTQPPTSNESDLKTSRNAYGPSHFAPSLSQTTGNSADGTQVRREEDTASTPLDVLQLGISLGLTELSAAAARSVLLHLETVSRSEAFEVSGMSKRELVVAALEAIRS